MKEFDVDEVWVCWVGASLFMAPGAFNWERRKRANGEMGGSSFTDRGLGRVESWDRPTPTPPAVEAS